MLKDIFNGMSLKGHPLVIFLLAGLLALAGGGGYLLGLTGNSAETGSSVEGTAEQGQTELWTCGMHPWIVSEEPGLCPICGMELTPKLEAADTPKADRERRIIYWRAPMDSAEIYDHPGKSKMGMDLVPVYDDEVRGGGEIRIDPVTRQNMGLRTARVVKGNLTRSLRSYGHITFDETRTAVVSPKFSGWLGKAHVDFTGQLVKRGQKLFDIYSPELLTAQEEYLAARKSLGDGGDGQAAPLSAAALQRLRYWDVPADQIREIEESGRVRKELTIRSPFTGTVTFNRAREGGFVKAGEVLYRITDLSRVVVEAHIFEDDLSWVRAGQDAVMTLPGLPGREFSGRVSYVFPYLEKKTRDVLLRLEFDNPDLLLRPEMYADIRIKTGAGGEGLTIPVEAVIRSGERNIVFVDRGDGKFSPREVSLGPSLDQGRIQILTGLGPGELVVVSGQFLLDSESKLQEAVQKMLEVRAPEPISGRDEEPGNPTSGDEDFFEDL